MVHNVPVKTLTHRGITIEGYSRAAVQTYSRIPEFKLGFDLGAHPWDFMSTASWFISHTHLDHVAALPVYVARRRMMKMEPPTIYLPEQAVEGVDRILKLFTRLDRGRLPCQLVGLKPGDEVEMSREHVVTVSATAHRVPSLGFVVWERRRKLKAEFQDLPGDKIRDLRLAGTEVTEERPHAARWPTSATVRRGAGRLPGHVRGPDADHRNDVRRCPAPQGKDPQVRPHAPRRRDRAPRQI